MGKINLAGVQTLEHPKSLDFVPSPYQEAIFDFARTGEGSGIIVAVAGSGKTTTLLRLCDFLTGSVAFAAFNKKIADEISFKLQQAGIGWQRVNAKTFHAFGLGAWKKVSPNVKVEAKKMDDICDQLGLKEEDANIVKKLVSIGKNHAVGVGNTAIDDMRFWEHLVNHYDLLADGADPNDTKYQEMLVRMSIASIKASASIDHEYIDFDDMLYAPLLHGATFWKNDWVLVDEAQDTNPTRRMVARRMLKPGGRLIAVGDPRQAIYGFTGADADALDLIKQEFDCKELPLTITYRCPKSVVRLAHTWVKHIEAAPNAPEGLVRTVTREEFIKEFPQMNERTAVICRNTKPLVRIALDMIRKKVACHVEGRDIGQQLITLIKRFKTNDASTMLHQLEEWGKTQTAKLREKRKDYEAQMLEDKIDSIRVFVEDAKVDATVWDIRSAITSLFGDTDPGSTPKGVTLSTVHKAKGREWPVVYLYGRSSFMPSMWAKQPWELTQEYNLCYVAVTRSMGTLIEVDLNLFREDETPTEQRAG